MKYKAEIKTSGLGSGIEMTAEEELCKMVWNAEYRHNHELRVRRYSFWKRETKRHGWKMTAQVGGWDKRQDTLTEMPSPPPELCDLAIKEWGKISVNFGDWRER